MIVIVPKWIDEKIHSYELLSYAWLYVIVQPDGRWFIYKNRFGPQEFVSPEEGLKIVESMKDEKMYKNLVSLAQNP